MSIVWQSEGISRELALSFHRAGFQETKLTLGASILTHLTIFLFSPPHFYCAHFSVFTHPSSEVSFLPLWMKATDEDSHVRFCGDTYFQFS